MHVICKNCGHEIPVAGRPQGSTDLHGVQLHGNVHVEGGSITFGPGGGISFGPAGSMSFGPPRPSEFRCPRCSTTAEYGASEILD
jgi:DNA-directed RNA polymerase subunit RPC12/RpoP